MSKPLSAKFWTAFVFKGKDPNDIHVTHKFLGEQPNKCVDEIERICNRYFNTPRPTFRPRFDKEQFFGVKNDIRVLVPSKAVDSFYLLSDLREELEVYRAEDFGDYLPHVSTPEYKVIEITLVAYVLMCGKNVYQRWDLVSM